MNYYFQNCQNPSGPLHHSVDKMLLDWQLVPVGGCWWRGVVSFASIIRCPPGYCPRPTLDCTSMITVTLQISPESTLSLFADDMTLFCTILTVEDYWALQCDVTAVATWINDNNLSLQPAKCCSMISYI